MEPALISRCELVNHELGIDSVSEILKITFDDMEKVWEDAGSPYQKWYRSVATGKEAIVDEALVAIGAFEHSRLIAWKTGKPFQPDNLFFRTVDSGRLLPMHLADFRVQYFAHKFDLERVDRVPGGRKKWASLLLVPYLHQLLVLRNMHDRGGGDIPVIITSWDEKRTNLSMDYWVDLSKGEWSEEEERKRYQECDNFCRHNLPCFFQTNMLVRALLSDPAVGYVPPFIVFHSVIPGGKTCVLFTHPLHVPPPSLIRNLPGSCNGPECPNDRCAAIDMNASHCLVANSRMVREWDTVLPRRVVCNLWGCNIAYSEDSAVKLQRCQRCREVLYCSRAHQSIDWRVHKNVCEKRT
ncbi:hypothetical protein B0H11DRAFT_2026489 [Mycena galericulata]|nr:hypothetical protein B0H11DRAFT_2026489 [Mycena galericulata]